MNGQLRYFFKNFSYSFSANIVSVGINILTLLILPKILSVSNYGYYQLYVFYSGYIGFLHLGLCDGVYLKYGGERYQELNYSVFSFQFWFLLVFEIIVTLLFLGLFFHLITEVNQKIILIYTLITVILVIPKTMLTYILQATNLIKQYGIITVSEKMLFFLFLLILVFFKIDSYKIILFSDLISKIFSLVLSIFFCKKIVYSKICFVLLGIQEIVENIKIGSRLMIANIASTLILGIIRQAIQRNWSIETFAKVSLTITISNMLMLFVGTVSIVLFPMLRRMRTELIIELYSSMRTGMMILLLGMLILYFPVYHFISVWLPSYIDGIRYMSILFPVCIYESKTSMLVNTYLKTLKKEKVLLKVNIITVLLSAVLTFINVYLLNNLNLTILSIVILFAIRSTLGEIFLSKYIKINIKKDICFELLLTVLFIYINWFIGGRQTFYIYLILYTIYLTIKRNEIKFLLRFFKRYAKMEL